MVYESDAVQTSFGIDTVNRLLYPPLSACGQNLFRAYVLHGFNDFLPCPFGEVVLFTFSVEAANFFLQCFITECLAELAGLERCSHLLSVIIQSSVHNTVVFLPRPHFP